MNITIYTTDTCAYCPMVKKFLDARKLSYNVIDTTNDLKARKTAQRLSGALTVPITVVEHIIDHSHQTGGWNTQDYSRSDVIVGWQPAKLAEAIKE